MNAYESVSGVHVKLTPVFSAMKLLDKLLNRTNESKKLVCYRSGWRQELVLNLENKKIHVFTGQVRERMRQDIVDACHVRRYASNEPRNSNLELVTPKLSNSVVVDYWRFESMDKLRLFLVGFRLLK